MKGKQTRGRRWWKCLHYNELQYAEANSDHKWEHLKEAHGITKTGRKTPIPTGKIKFNNPFNPDNPIIRPSSAYIQLIITIIRKPFEDALVALVIICQLALSLIVNDMFYTFLKVVFLKIDDVLLRSSHIIRKWVIEYFEKRKKQLKKELKKCQSNVNFSFDL